MLLLVVLWTRLAFAHWLVDNTCSAVGHASKQAGARRLALPACALKAGLVTALLGCSPAGDAIAVDSHCFGCTAGAGSGCQGSTS